MSDRTFALFCEVDHTKESLRHAIRAEHLAFLDARKDRIVFGGPLTGDDGAPQTMLLVVRADDAAAARAFLDDEPYRRSGVFSSVTPRAWTQVLPEVVPGAMAAAIAAERAAHP